MPLCEGCGSSYEDTFKFCPQCGRAKPEPRKLVVEVDVKGRPHDFDCPLCGDASAIQKVSAIVEGGTNISQGNSYSSGESRVYYERTGEHVGSSISSSSTSTYQKSQSKLAQKLVMPDPPREPQKGDFEIGERFFTGIFGAVYLAAIVPIWGFADAGSNAGSVLLVLFCITPLVAGVGAILIAWLIHKAMGSNEKYQHAMEKYKEEMLIYDKTSTHWNELFYCHKHDVVYTLSKRKPVPVKDAIPYCIHCAE
jgi:hypothetical protein